MKSTVILVEILLLRRMTGFSYAIIIITAVAEEIPSIMLIEGLYAISKSGFISKW